MSSQKLSLSWFNKDKAVIADGAGGFEWVEKSDPRLSEVRLLTPVRSVGEVTNTASDNLLIRGDSYDALHALARVPEYAENYKGKIKLVYIDPPFNTGQAFEHYDDALDHSIWLTLMRDRLRLIKQLLAPDGSIWVHLDDVEVHRMRLLMDEIFGASAFVAEVAWRATDSSSNNAKGFAKDHNVILVYGRRPNWRPYQLHDQDKSGHYKNPNNDPRGPWYDGRDVQNPKIRPNLMYDVIAPNGNVIKHPKNGWRWERNTLEAKLETGELFFNESMTVIKRIAYLWEQEGLPPSDLWFSNKQTGSSRQAKNHLKALFPDLLTPDIFDTPKPEQLIARVLELGTRPGETVLDCFAGSGTTAAVAHKLQRSWVTVEVLQSTIDEFARPRLEAVVSGNDPGGITSSTERVAAEGVTLPEGVTPADAQRFQTVLGEVLDGGPPLEIDLAVELSKLVRKDANTGDPRLTAEQSRVLLALLRTFNQAGEKIDVSPIVKAELSRRTKTRKETTDHWQGGGGFQQLAVSPSVYVRQGQFTLLNESVTGSSFVAYVAANLGFLLTNDREGLVGVKGRVRLAVIDGVVDEDIARIALLGLNEDETLTIVGRSYMPEVPAFLREKRRGSRVMKAPGDLLARSAVVR